MGTSKKKRLKTAVLISAFTLALLLITGFSEAGDSSSSVYLTGQISLIGGKQYLVQKGSRKFLIDPPVNFADGTWANIKGELSQKGSRTALTPEASVAVRKPSEVTYPHDLSYDPNLISTEPFSDRTLQFGKVYSRMAAGIRTYLGGSSTLSSYDFEPHVMSDLAWYLKNMEQALSLMEQLQGGGSGFSKLNALVHVNHGLLKMTEDSGLRNAALHLCLSNGPKNNALKEAELVADYQGSRANCYEELKNLYINLTSLNMYLFRHNAGADESPYILYFKTAESDPNFNGRVSFPSDVNGILREAFYHLYLASNLPEGDDQKKQMEQFNLLLIGHEQIIAQGYYDQMEAEQKAIAGFIQIKDPIGTYKLTDNAWSDFSARMSLNLRPGTRPQDINPSILLGTSYRPGSVPDYYRSRLYDKDSKALLAIPPEISSASIDRVKIGKGVPALTNLSGQALVKSYGCVSCHQIGNLSRGSTVGPNLTHVASWLSSAQIEKAIKDPNSVNARNALTGACYPKNVMPLDFDRMLNPGDIAKIVDYLEENDR